MNKKLLLLFTFYAVFFSTKAQTITITLHGDTVLEVPVATAYNEPGYDAKDSAGNDYTQYVIVANGSLNTTILGSYQIRYYIPDSIGKSDIKYRIIHIVDVISPTIQLIGDDTLCFHLGEQYVEPGVKILDNYDVGIVPRIISDMPLNSNNQHYLKDSICYQILYYAKDTSGNFSDTIRRTACVCYSSITGINSINNDLKDVKIYPNPAHDKINIEGINSIELISIYDLFGKCVYSISTSENAVSLHSLNKGVYFIRINNKQGQTAIKKIIVQ